MKSSKSPGLDEVPNILLKKLPGKAIKFLVTIFNSCLRFNYFPSAFKKAKIIAIHKANKPANDPKSYRPISLLSNLGKVYEKLLYFRVNDFITEHNIILKEQFGFKREHSTVHQINRIKNKIVTNKYNKKSTGIILLDIEKAFDSVWHNGLIYKLIKTNLPTYLCKILADFLDNRSYIVSVNNTFSPTKPIPAGLPQGSILSPLLYNIFTSDFKPPSEIDVACYADDTALITSSKLTSALLKKMERSLTICNKYFTKWKIQMNCDKTQAIILPYNKSYKRRPNRQLQFQNNTIEVKDEVKYLGVIIDKKLNFGKHIEYSRKKANNALRSLRALLNRRSVLCHKNKNLIFKCVLRPILTYASPVWYNAAKCHLKKLQIIQNKCLKIINNKHWRYPTSRLHNESNYELFTEFIDRQNLNFFNRAHNSSYEIIRECTDL